MLLARIRGGTQLVLGAVAPEAVSSNLTGMVRTEGPHSRSRVVGNAFRKKVRET